MKERPILFSAPMVRAILAGQKTVTRRIVTTREPVSFLGGAHEQNDPACWGWFFDGPDHHGYAVLARGLNERENHGRISIPSPYGEPGDRLWVRETHVPRYFDDGRPAYRAEWDGRAADCVPEPKWKPSIFMRRHDSRITLEVTHVRVERLQAITPADILAEGVVARSHDDPNLGRCPVSSFDGKAYVDLRSLWCAGWDSINGKRAAWATNPWVWVVGFQRIDEEKRSHAAE